MSRDAVLAHARQICQDMLSEQQYQADHDGLPAASRVDGRSCPTATRLEGLLAALTFLPAGDAPLAGDAARVDRGRHAVSAALPDHFGTACRRLPRVLPGYRQPDNLDKQRAQEVRIDYVQHALSAMIQFEEEFSKK